MLFVFQRNEKFPVPKLLPPNSNRKIWPSAVQCAYTYLAALLTRAKKTAIPAASEAASAVKVKLTELSSEANGAAEVYPSGF